MKIKWVVYEIEDCRIETDNPASSCFNLLKEWCSFQTEHQAMEHIHTLLQQGHKEQFTYLKVYYN
jgi:hypothetical protein